MDTVEHDNVSYDLGNLAIFSNGEIPIKRAKNSDYLKSIATEHAQLLLNQLCQLPSEPTQESGRLVVLPEPTTPLPREKPIPEEKPLTKWEKFAKQKGIVKRKKDKLVWDDEHQDWRDRYGSNKANDLSSQWAIAENEVKSKDPTHKGLDPWSILEKQKKERVSKNTKQNQKNIQMSTVTQRKGSAAVLDLSTTIGKAAPGKRNALHKEKKGKSHVDIALTIAQKSTNSMGKFDKLRSGEERVVHKTKSNIADLHKYASEQQQSAKVMKKVLGKQKESEAINLRKAMHAIGATSIKSGELTTLKGIRSSRKLKEKMHKAQKDSKFSRVNARMGKGKPGARSGKPSGKSSGSKPSAKPRGKK